MSRILIFLFLAVPHSLFGAEFFMGAKVSKKEIVQFEPVVLRVWVENLTGEPKKIIRGFDLSFGYLRIFVIDPEGREHQIKPPAIANIIPEYMTLSGFGVVHHRIALTSYPGGWMDKPGKYRLKAIFNHDGADSEPLGVVVELTVKRAKRVNKKALKWFRGYPQGKYLGNETTCPAIGEAFEVVLLKYPESDYAPWCYYVLGRASQRQKQMAEQARAEWARRHYEQLLKKFPDFPLKAEVKYEMARELMRLGNREEAIREIEKLIEIDKGANESDPNTFLFYKARRVLTTFGDGNQKLEYHQLPSHLQ